MTTEKDITTNNIKSSYEYNEAIVSKVRDTLVRASSTFREDQKSAYSRGIAKETNETAQWVLETILKNAEIAEKNQSPLCDDTGTPHLILEIGPNKAVTGAMLDSIREGVRQGLRKLPGRPMAVLGEGAETLDQGLGLDEDPGALAAAPFLIRNTDEDVVRLHVLMLGGGPALRGKTLHVFHKHNIQTVMDEIVKWAIEETGLLGCTPSVLAIGIGRSQFEASSMMMQALIDRNFDEQDEWEQQITDRVNQVGVGASALGGNTTVLATFMKIGLQRASGWRVVCLRTCCCFEPRVASVEL
ncbi:MAG: fumarate hydratase [Lachnospiraceae bacterium]|nr:fumarate hydratase [Lachnospiraceae bacterium]